ncbi:MAG: DsrE family protein [Nitrospirae bacterium]|nr:DsrE family protein [Nitrospirota bacterium]
MRKLALALTTRPEDPSSRTTINLAKAALEKKIEVYLYVTDEGVYHLTGSPLFDLVAQGAKLYVCAYGCQSRNLPYDDPRATYCGLVMLGSLIEGTDRFISLN